jgi:peptidoglycan/LPS O-acetylase OafA/YrhL
MTDQNSMQTQMQDLLPRQVPKRLPYMPGIDGLRAIAVIAVVLYHAQFGFIPGGFLGVEVFLVISGYLITSLLLLERVQTGGNDLKRFWLRRARRLLPALGVLLILVVTAALAFAPDALYRLDQDVLGALTYSTNWVSIFRQESYFEAFARPPVLRHLWSLAVEEQFYLIFPLIFTGGMLVLSRRSSGYGQTARRFMATAAVGAIASTALMWFLFVPYEDPTRVYFGTDTRASGLLIGVGLAFLWQPWRFTRKLRERGVVILNSAGFITLALLTLMLLRMGEYDPWLYRGGFLVTSLLTATVIAVTVHPQGLLNPVLGNRALVWVGKRSYGLYLYHWPIFVFLRPGVDVSWGFWPTFAVQMALTLAITEASYRWIEQPIRRYGFKTWIASITEPLRKLSPQAAALWPVIAAVFVLGLALGLVRGASTPPPGEGIVASAPDGAVTVDETTTTTTTTSLPSGVTPTTDASTATTRLTIPEFTVPPPVMIGDSVMLGAKKGLEHAVEGARVYAKVSRQMSQIPDVIQDVRRDGPFGDVVVIHLGTNGPFNSGHFDTAMDALSNISRVYFVNASVPRRYEGQVNKALEDGVARWDNAYLIDWNATADGHPEYFVKDGVHLTTEGIKAYSAMVARAIER